MEQAYVKEMVEAGLYLIPDHMWDAVRGYYYHGHQPGSFLIALLSNDFMRACSSADEDNLYSLPRWARFLYNHVPSGSYGSPEKVRDWLASFAEAA